MKVKEMRLPREFLEEYRRDIAVRVFGSLFIINLFIFISTRIDFSDAKYPTAAMIFVILCGLALAAIIFRMYNFLKPSWVGKIVKIESGYRTKTKNKGFEKRLIVTVTVEREGKGEYRAELFRTPTDRASTTAMRGENLYHIYAPYKVGDTVLYLRGMRIFARVGVENVSELEDPHFVCPYCGEINKAEREKCFSCGRILLK